MRALLCYANGDIDTLRLEETLAPAFTAGGVRIAVHAAGVNFADLLITRGEYQVKPPHPFAPGMEVAGVVTEVAPGVTHVSPGDRVLAFLDHGGFAEEVVAPGRDVARIPDSMDWPTAAAFPVAYATSHLALRHRARLEAGEVLLVHGASGGVGLTAVEVGKAAGATVIATASSAEKLEVARQHGADHLVDSSGDVREQVLALTGGADVVYDPVGGDLFTASLRCVKPGGRILVIGFASGTVPQIPANHLLVKDVAAMGFSLGQMRQHRPDAMQGALAELLDWYADGRLHPLVSALVPFEEAVDALALLRDRRSTGKVVVRIRPEGA
ncbi:MAG: NADPH:quinone oxidoreductase family protein [Chloroflexi bacterium]|nr:NADPH:quinone oxidoreductase family protein [Chloroflexota bacterium]MDA1239833.1 NADPH:quinone oxidoreductase family protein [Chloroflexota bacterium]